MAEGLHILADFFQCKENTELLTDKEKLEKESIKIIKEQGLTVVGKEFYKFGEGGITGVVLIAESHFSIHTWPEKDNFIALDIYVCNFEKDNSEKVRNIFKKLKEIFKPEKVKKKAVIR